MFKSFDFDVLVLRDKITSSKVLKRYLKIGKILKCRYINFFYTFGYL